LLLGVAGVGFGAGGARPEPAFYCRLAFGPEGKVGVLVCWQGESLVLQRRSGGKQAVKTDRFARLPDCKDVTVHDPDGKTTYIIRSVEDLKLVRDLDKGLALEVEVKGPLAYRQGAFVRLARSAARAPTVRFHAPLTIGPAQNIKRTFFGILVWRTPANLALTRDAPAELFVTIRNRSQQPDSQVVVVTSDPTGKKCLFPDKVRPVAEVEFPPGKAGGKPIRRRYTLTSFC
jgi:hypothetical protein